MGVDKHLKNVQDKLETYEQSAQKIKIINEEEIIIWVAKYFVYKYLLDDLLRLILPKVKEIESQLAKRGVTAQL